MKKGLIFATTLAMALGVGVAVGARQSKAAEVKAEEAGTVIYLDVSGGDWFSDSAKVAIWNHQGGCFEEFESDSESGLYKATLSAACTSFNLFRGSALNWDNRWNQSDDSTFVSGKNLIKSTGYYDNKLAFYWDVYVPAVDPEYHLLGTFNDWKDPEGDYILTVDSKDANHYTIVDVVMTAEDELKVVDVPNNIWYGNHDNNVVVGESGTYDVDFYVNAENGVHVVLTKHLVPVVYTVKYGSSSYNFALDDEHKPEGADHQYKATIDNPYIFRARTLEFYADDVKIASNIGVDYDMEKGEPVPGNNIVGDAINGFKVYTSNSGMDVYLKQYGSSFSLWGTEYADNTFDLTYDASSLGTLSVDDGFVPYDDYVKQYKTSSKVSLERLDALEESGNYYFSDTLGASQNISIETAGENNAVSKGLVYFDVHNDCNEVVYLKEKADLSLWLYIDGYVEEHVVTIAGHEIPLTKANDGQYVAHGVNLSAGDTVTKYTIEGVDVVGLTSKKVANNNLGEDMKVVADVASADIYYTVAVKTLWISGLPDAGQHLLVNGHTAVEMHHTDPYDGYDQYASGMLTFAANDTIKVLNTGADDSYAVVWCPEIIGKSPALAEKFVYDSENHQMKCVSGCSAAVYLKIKDKVDEVYFGDVPEYVTEAVGYANGFKSAMSTSCSATEGKEAAVKSAWGAQATAFKGLSEQAKAEILKGSESLVDEIQEFAERYVGIYKQLGAKYDLEEFLDWKVPSVRFYNEIGSIADNSTMIIVITIAAASALAFTLLLVFKKKKQK